MTEGRRLIVDLLRYAAEHEREVARLLALLAWTERDGGEQLPEPSQEVRVAEHYYPH